MEKEPWQLFSIPKLLEMGASREDINKRVIRDALLNATQTQGEKMEFT